MDRNFILRRGRNDMAANGDRHVKVRVVFRILVAFAFAMSQTQSWEIVGAAEGVAAPAEAVWPMPQWARAEPAEVGMDEGKLAQARDYALTGGGSGSITRHGRLVMAWGDPRARYDLKSTTK